MSTCLKGEKPFFNETNEVHMAEGITLLEVEGIKVIRVELPYFDEIEVIPFGDVHVGEEWTNLNIVNDTIRYILDRPNRFVILNGDLMDMALKMSVSDSYGATLSPMEQVQSVAKLFKPLVDNKRVLAMGTGNHEDRTYKFVGLDASRMLALELGIVDRYADNSFVLFVKFGKTAQSYEGRLKQNVYSFFCSHGYGGGKKSGSKMNNVVDMTRTAEADIYIFSHVHDVMGKPSDSFRCDYQNMTISRTTKWHLISNSWQNFGGYSLKQGFPPASREVGYVVLNGNGRKRVKLRIGL